MTSDLSTNQTFATINPENEEVILLRIKFFHWSKFACVCTNYVSDHLHKKKVIVQVQRANEEDVDIAVAAARTAFKSWRDIPGAPPCRCSYIYAYLQTAT